MAATNAGRNGIEVHHDDERDGPLLALLTDLVGPFAGCPIVGLRVPRLALAFSAGGLGRESRFPCRGPGARRARQRYMVSGSHPCREAVAGRARSLRRPGT